MNTQPVVYILASKRKDVKQLEASLETTIDRKKQSEWASPVCVRTRTGRQVPMLQTVYAYLVFNLQVMTDNQLHLTLTPDQVRGRL